MTPTEPVRGAGSTGRRWRTGAWSPGLPGWMGTRVTTWLMRTSWSRSAGPGNKQHGRSWSSQRGICVRGIRVVSCVKWQKIYKVHGPNTKSSQVYFTRKTSTFFFRNTNLTITFGCSFSLYFKRITIYHISWGKASMFHKPMSHFCSCWNALRNAL